MDFKITVPDELLTHPVANTKELQTILTRMLILELSRQGCLTRETAAQASGLAPEDFDTMANSIKPDISVYRPPARENFYPGETTTPPARDRSWVPVVVILLIGLAVAAFYYHGRLISGYYTRQGLNLLISQKKDEASWMFRRAANADPRNETANTELGKYYIEKGEKAADAGRKAESENEFKNALVYLAKVIEAAPNNPHALYDAGYANEMLGDIEQAKKYYRLALSAEPGYPSAAVRLDNLENMKNQSGATGKPPEKPN